MVDKAERSLLLGGIAVVEQRVLLQDRSQEHVLQQGEQCSYLFVLSIKFSFIKCFL